MSMMVQSGRFASYAPETVALLARMSTTTSQQKQDIDTLIRSLITANIWSKLDGLYIHAAHDAAAGLLNWVNTVYNMTAVSSPVFTADRGYLTDGTASYLNSNFNPVTAPSPKWVQDSVTAFIWSRTIGQTGGTTAGNDPLSVSITPRSTSDVFRARASGSAALDAACTNGTGLFATTRSLAGVRKSYRNGAEQATITDASSSHISATFKVGTANASTFVSREFAATGFGSELNNTDHQNLYNAIQTYMTARGA
jgi:hypothetical protein